MKKVRVLITVILIALLALGFFSTFFSKIDSAAESKKYVSQARDYCERGSKYLTTSCPDMT